MTGGVSKLDHSCLAAAQLALQCDQVSSTLSMLAIVPSQFFLLVVIREEVDPNPAEGQA